MARPPQFDRSEVLWKATVLFWERGYRGVSINDLVKATGLLPGSIYAGFGNKEGLFIACLEHYSLSAEKIRAEFETEESPLAGVKRFYTTMAEQSADTADRRGCLLVNASLECDKSDAAIKATVSECMAKGEAWLRAQLEDAKMVGEISAETDTEKLAACLMGSVFGLRVMSRAQDEAEKIRAVAEATFEGLVAPWQQVAA